MRAKFKKHRHEHAQLQLITTKPVDTTPIAENSHTNNHPPEPTEITEFLGEEILYQQTIPATEPNFKTESEKFRGRWGLTEF
ncbi:MAG: hypothetical protein ACK4YS_02715 [Aphanizomenon sp.]|jgi:hypothetical protein